jgi:DNA-binding NarL/FixJ family response regulator
LITFLVIEDSPRKLKNICEAITDLGVDSRCIDKAEGINEALEKLKDNTYDFAVLDMILPQFKGDDDKIKRGGLDILDELSDSISAQSETYKIPQTILVLTEFEDVLVEYQEAISQSKVFGYCYDHCSIDWVDAIKDEYLRIKAVKSSEQRKYDSEVVLLSVHGIRTFGEWQKKLSNSIVDRVEGSKPLEYRYNFFPIINFLSKEQQEKEVIKFSNALLDISNTHPRAKINLVGHSFGTYIIYNGLIKIKEKLNLGNIIFAGSVLNPDLDLTLLYKKHNLTKIVNECSTFDMPLLAGRLFTNIFFTAGMTGFSGADNVVTNRYIKGGHSSYFKQNILDEWCDFIVTNTIKEKNEQVDGIMQDLISTIIAKRRTFFIPLGVLVALGLLSLGNSIFNG